MEEIGPPPQIERIGELLRELFLKVGLVAATFTFALEIVVVAVERCRRGCGLRINLQGTFYAYFPARRARVRVGMNLPQLLTVVRWRVASIGVGLAVPLLTL